MKFLKLRFSLRTLLCFVLLLGSAFLFWWNWEAFVPVFQIHEDAPAEIQFSADDSRIYTFRAESEYINQQATTTARFFHVYDSHDGKQIYKFIMSGKYDAQFLISEDEEFVAYYQKHSNSSLLELSGLWSLKTGGDLYSAERGFANVKELFVFSKARTAFVWRGFETASQIVRFPSLEVIRELTDRDSEMFPGKEVFGLVGNSKVTICSASDGAVVRIFNIPEKRKQGGIVLKIGPKDDIFALEYWDGNSCDKTYLFDLKTDAPIAQFEKSQLVLFAPDGNNLLISHDTDSSLVYHVATQSTSRIQSTFYHFRSGCCGDQIVNYDLRIAWDPFGNQTADWNQWGDRSDPGKGCYFGIRGHGLDEEKARNIHIIHVEKVEPIGQLHAYRWRKQFSDEIGQLIFARRSPAFISNQTVTKYFADGRYTGIRPGTDFTVWKLDKNLPWDAWKMPELYLTLTSLAAFIWSLTRKSPSASKVYSIVKESR